MTTIQNFDELHGAAMHRFPGRTVQAEDGGEPVLHLYHAPNSICSQKVRAVLLATQQPFVSHTIDIFKGETYDPDYVRLRLTGCKAAGLPLAANHTGATSIAASGCDACVVPTVVDHDAANVLVDSKNICIALDRRNPAAPGALMPEGLRVAIDAEISIVDNLPNYQLLAVAVGKPDAAAADNSFAVSKVRRCDALLAEYASDAALCSAYAAKRAKEQAAADRLFAADAMTQARTRIEDALHQLDARCLKSSGPFLFGASLTMADLFWGVELIRIDDLGMSQVWADGKLPSLAAYYERISRHPAVLGAVTEWPGARLKSKAHS